MLFHEQQNNVSQQSRFVHVLSKPALIGLLLAVVTLAVYWPVRNCDFVCYDDPGYFSSNAHVLGGWTLANVGWAFKNGDAANWHPLTWLSLMLDAELFGKGPAAPHLTNLFFHAANTVLLFLLLRKLTSATWRSAFVAALFALHPLHVESVAWVAERKDVLSMFFALLALLSYARYAQIKGESKKENGESPTGRLSLPYACSLILFALGLMSKPMLVTLPFVMLLLDFWPLKRFPLSAFRLPLLLEKIPFFLLSAISCAATFIVQQKGGAVATLTRFSMPARIENAFVSYARYLGKTFWPDALANPYPHPGQWPLALVLFSAALFAGLCFAAVRLARKFPFAFTGWFWFAGTLIPVIGLVQVGGQPMADRYAYLPLTGIFIIFVWGVAELFVRWSVPKPPVILFSILLLAACAAQTGKQLGFWRNDKTLFSHALAVTENNYIAAVNLGTWFSKNGQTGEALNDYYLALEMNPDDPSVLYDVGNAFAKIGYLDEAIGDYRHALQVTPDQPDILDNLGFALAAKKQFAEAVTNFEAALKVKPDSASAHNNLATVLFRQGNFQDAAQHYRASLKIMPDNPQIWDNLGDTLVRLNQPAEAVKCYQQALKLNPGDARIKTKLQSLGGQ